MKKIINIVLLSAFVTVLGISCNKDGDEASGKYPILFRCPEVSRAETTVEDMQGDANGFEVYSYFEVGDKKFNFKKTVTYNAAQGIWDYTDIEYWISGATYWFKAVYPKSLNYTIDNTTSAQNLTITDYNVTSQTDILVAEPTREGGMTVDATIGAPATGSTVNLQFKHLLANVVIGVKTEISGVEVKKISLVGVAQTGSYDGTMPIPWSATQTTTITKTYGKSLSSGSEKYTDVTDGGFYVIPQNISGEQKLQIETSNKNYDIAIPNITWTAGTQYTYTLTIKQNDILFNEPTIVEEWDETSATGSVLIK